MTALDALEELGYLRRDRNQDHQENGKFGGVRYVFFDAPTQPCIDFPNTVEPYTDEPYTENPPQEIIKQETQKQEKPPISPKNGKAQIPAEVLSRIETYAGPDMQLRDALVHFAENRQAIKKPIKTQHAMTLLLSTLDKASEGDRALKIDLIREAETRNWLSFYRHDDRRKTAKAPPPAEYEPEVRAWQ